VQGSAVVLREDRPGHLHLVAYVVIDAGVANIATLRESLCGRLPEHMLPAAWVVLDALPRLPNGKLDRRALPAPQAEEAAAYVAPRTPLESVLAELWCEVLGVARVGVHDHFFELGGHSLLAARLVSQVRRDLQPRCSLATLFKSPTLEGFAGALERISKTADGGAERGELLALQALGSGPALFCICGVHLYAPLARLLAPDHPVYGVFLPYEHSLLASAPGVAPQLPSVEQMAADYVREIRRQQPDGPYHLLGVSFGGLLAYEVAQQLSAAGVAVGAVTVLDFDFDAGRPRRWSERLAHRLRALPKRWQAIMKPRERLDAVAHATPGAPRPSDEEQRLIDLRDRIYEQAIAAYVPQPYGGRVHVVRAEETLATAGHQPAADYGWARHVRDLCLEDVAGGHVSMLAEPHVHALAVCVRRHLAPSR
jgi:thioesterase domain-containing protein